MTDASPAPRGGGMFSPFEWMVALRYLRARRADGFVSVIVLFSFLGIVLGVATLIVVMSVMNGFHRELMDKILGFNGHAFVQSAEPPFTRLAQRHEAALLHPRRDARRAPGRKRRGGLLAGQADGRLRARHSRGRPQAPAGRRRQCARRDLRRLRQGGRRRDRLASRRAARRWRRRQGEPHHRQGRADALRRDAAHQGLSGRRDLLDRHVGIRQPLPLYAASRGADFLQPREGGHGHRGLRRQPGQDRRFHLRRRQI